MDPSQPDTNAEEPSVERDETASVPATGKPATPEPTIQLGGLADGQGTRESYAVSIDAFEGPLDLLLHLVRRHELDILDIPIAFITEKYIEYLEFARALDIEIAGDYLVMAATLAFLKSRELLPPDPNEQVEEEAEDEGVDPREELIRRLIEYERFRAAGDELDQRPISGRDVFVRGGELDVVLPEPDLAPVTLFRLAEAYNRILERARINKSHDVDIEPVTVRQRMKQLSMLLTDSPRLEFEGLFLTRTWRSAHELRQMLVVTLMSVLELAKLGVLSVHQPEGSETILLERVADAGDVDRLMEAFREDDEDDAPDPLAAVAAEAPGPDPAPDPGPELPSTGDVGDAGTADVDSTTDSDPPKS